MSSKIHALVDAKGRPVKLVLTAGQRADAPVGDQLAEQIDPGATLLADKAYDTNAVRKTLKERKGWANIPARANRTEAFAVSG